MSRSNTYEEPALCRARELAPGFGEWCAFASRGGFWLAFLLRGITSGPSGNTP